MRKLLPLLIAIVSILPALAQDLPQKREMRSAWVATVWRLDWPQNVISSTGNESQIASQKNDLTTMLDSMALNNMNAVNFQVRSRCDAMYRSSYEPWSSDLVSTRGMDPGYDPLEFCVQECHKRGLECHAWINPYRYESQVGQWNGTPQAYRQDHPDWIMDVKGASILNPAKPEVIQRICDIAAEIVTNYDVDGLLFDDYFYLSGTTDDQDGDLYAAYTAAGGTLIQKDWRRDNVNRMVAAVYRTVKAIKPWIRFGVSPAGIACTSATVARSYGIAPCPTGSDWQYNDIYSDPIAWLAQGSLDFISPQIYWTIGNSTDYDRAAKWWSEIADHFGRHFYSSHSISSLTASSKAPGMSEAEQTISTLASGPNNATFEEYANQIRLNRQYTLNEAPGSIFYSVKYMYRTAPLFAHHLRKGVFNTPALLPAMSWQPQQAPGTISAVTLSGTQLSWKPLSGMRYTVYAVPASVGMTNFNREAEYLLGTSYSPVYNVPAELAEAGYLFAVCPLDRYGNEFAPVFAGAEVGALAAPQLTSPADGAAVEMPFTFAWADVPGASSYVLELSDDASFGTLTETVPVNGTSVSSDAVRTLASGVKAFWRVRALGNNAADAVSAVRSLTPSRLTIINPTDNETNVSLTPTIGWSFPGSEVTVQVSTHSDFTDDHIVFAGTTSAATITMPSYVLMAATNYFARVLYTRGDQQYVSPVVSFTTIERSAATPSFVCPVHGGTLHADETVAVTPMEGARSIRLEVSASQTFPARQSYITSSVDRTTGLDKAEAAKIRIVGKALADGGTYYARTLATFPSFDGDIKSEYSEPITFTFSSTSGVTDIEADGASISVDAQSILHLTLAAPGRLTVTDMAGRTVLTAAFTAAGAHTVSLAHLPAGVYVANAAGTSLKFAL